MSGDSPTSFLLLLVDVVIQQLYDQVHVRQDHAAAAVALAAKLVQGLRRCHALLVNQVEVLVPLVARDLNTQLGKVCLPFHK